MAKESFPNNSSELASAERAREVAQGRLNRKEKKFSNLGNVGRADMTARDREEIAALDARIAELRAQEEVERRNVGPGNDSILIERPKRKGFFRRVFGFFFSKKKTEDRPEPVAVEPLEETSPKVETVALPTLEEVADELIEIVFADLPESSATTKKRIKRQIEKSLKIAEGNEPDVFEEYVAHVAAYQATKDAAAEEWLKRSFLVRNALAEITAEKEVRKIFTERDKKEEQGIDGYEYMTTLNTDFNKEASTYVFEREGDKRGFVAILNRYLKIAKKAQKEEEFFKVLRLYVDDSEKGSLSDQKKSCIQEFVADRSLKKVSRKK